MLRDEVKEQEVPLEKEVSNAIGAMPFLWFAVGDNPGPTNTRGLIERNSIALLSNFRRESVDPPSPHWLGQYSDRDKVRASSLWNNRHVDEKYNPEFLDVLAQYVDKSE